MDFLKYDIKDSGAFVPFISAMGDTGADIDGSRVMFESDNSAAKMLADALVEYEIMAPVMEGPMPVKPKAAAAAGAAGDTVPAASGTPAAGSKKGPVVKKAPAGKTGTGPKAGAPGVSDGEDPSKVVVSEGGPKVPKKKPAAPAPEDPNKKGVYASIIEKVDSLGLDDGMKKAIEKKVTAFIDGEVKKAGDKGSEIYVRLANNPMSISKIVFTIVQRVNPELYEELKKAGKLGDKGENAASLTRKSEISKALSQIVGQVEVPDAFNVEIDDSEWENALITAFGFPMINLTSTLVREMLRAQEPKAQKRAYKEFKKQLKADPDVAKALGIGVMGTLGLGGGKNDATTDKKARIDTRAEGVDADGKVLVEGAVTDISNALKNPVDVLKSIAGNKGTPCRRNNLVVMYKEIDGKSGDSNENATVIPLGVSGGTLVDLNKSVPVPMSHLTAFYSVVDPKASFKSYAKAMAEVNAKSDNASKGLGDAAAAAGKKLLSKIPLLGRGAKKELEAKEADGITKAMGELAMYIKENGHPPFYLLKPKGEPKEVDHWSDEDAANGYQMITMMVDGHKAGMILKAKTAEALFKVG